MKRPTTMVLALTLGSILAIGTSACGHNAQPAPNGSRDSAGAEAGGSAQGSPMAVDANGSWGAMMDHMQQMHGQFQMMSGQDHWMHAGSMMSGSQHMMALSKEFSTMADAMHEAMGQLQSLMSESEGEHGTISISLNRMQNHLQVMSEQLDQMHQEMDALSQGAEQ